MGMAAAHCEGCALLCVADGNGDSPGAGDGDSTDGDAGDGDDYSPDLAPAMALTMVLAMAMITVLVLAMAMAPALVRWLRAGVRYVTNWIATLSFAALCAEAGQGSCSRLLLMVMMPFE